MQHKQIGSKLQRASLRMMQILLSGDYQQSSFEITVAIQINLDIIYTQNVGHVSQCEWQ